MIEFRTKLPVHRYSFSIGYNTPILSIGSCFAENIGRKLASQKIPILVNPFGILYNPGSIIKALERTLEANPYTEEDLVNHNQLWHSFEHHGQFSTTDRQECLSRINASLFRAAEFLLGTSVLNLTLGTAFYFEYRPTGEVVANCHKMPGNLFARKKYEVEEIVENFSRVLCEIRGRHPDVNVVMTVSPVRHVRDGLVPNMQSKATLVLAVEKLTQQLPFVHYFPAYEIMMDDLRDYRFYKSDLLHPSDLAIDYIWEHFQQCVLSEDAQELIPQVTAFAKASEHRPLFPRSENHRKFVANQIRKMENFEKQHPLISLATEKKILLDSLR